MDAALSSLLSDAVSSGATPGVSALVATADDILFDGSAGVFSADDPRPLSSATTFRLASMTKIATVLAAARLLERRELDLDAPVASVRPEWDDLVVLDEAAPGGTRPPRTVATIRELFTHTAGLGYHVWDERLLSYITAAGIPDIASGLRACFRAPLVADPGTRFDYGTSTDWLGLVIETTTGQPLPSAVSELVLDPLGMSETTAELDPAHACVPVTMRGEDGGWHDSGVGNAPHPEFYAGGHFLHSTPRDFLRLQRMLLAGGRAASGEQVINAETYAQLVSPQLGSLALRTMPSAIPAIAGDIVLDPADSWGLGVLVTRRALPSRRHPGSFGWMGMYNTLWWVDPVAGITASLYTQTLPAFGDDAVALFDRFEEAVYSTLSE